MSPMTPATVRQSLLEQEDWDTLLGSIAGDAEGDYCTPILGPEACDGTLDLRKKIAQALALGPPYCPLEYHRDLIQVSQYRAVMTPNLRVFHQAFARHFREELTAAHLPAARTRSYDILANLPISLYATTNLDTLMMTALERRPKPAKQPHEELCVWSGRVTELKPKSVLRDPNFRLHPATPVVYYLFGNVNHPLSMVLSEDDHLDFFTQVATASEASMAAHEETPSEVWDKSVLTNKFVDRLRRGHLLFLGYRLQDFDFRILLRSLKSILARSSSMRIPLIAVQLEAATGAEVAMSAQQLRNYLESFCLRHKIKVFWGTCTEFIEELGERYAAFTKTAPAPARVTP
jgi:hypothetical protein